MQNPSDLPVGAPVLCRLPLRRTAAPWNDAPSPADDQATSPTQHILCYFACPGTPVIGKHVDQTTEPKKPPGCRERTHILEGRDMAGLSIAAHAMQAYLPVHHTQVQQPEVQISTNRKLHFGVQGFRVTLNPKP